MQQQQQRTHAPQLKVIAQIIACHGAFVAK